MLDGAVIDVEHPAAALLTVCQDAQVVTGRLKQQIAAGGMTPALIDQLGDWLDRVARLSRLALEAGGPSEAQQSTVDMAAVTLLLDTITAVLRAAGVDQSVIATIPGELLAAIEAEMGIPDPTPRLVQGGWQKP